MDKKPKSETDNQWTSLPEDPGNEGYSCKKKPKSETDNQWTSTIKNNIDEKK